MAKNKPKPYEEAGGWAFRVRRGETDIYRSGYMSQRAASKALGELVDELEGNDKPAHMGPYKTSVGVGLMDYARERLPYLKGARQEANRINRYLRKLGLPVIHLEKAPADMAPLKASLRGTAEPPKVHFVVSFESEDERNVVASLQGHRDGLDAEGAKSDAIRARIARTAMAEVSPHVLQAYVNQMNVDGFGASSVHLEVAVLRQLFTHARKTWRWPRPVRNPAAGLTLPTLGDGRDRVLSAEEWKALSVSLARYDNANVLPLISLMLESAMRSCEPLTLMTWKCVDWERGVLHLPDGKGGARDVPLSVDALRILRYLEALHPKAAPDGLVFDTTYAAVNKAWRVACQEAGIAGVKLHDVRHTSATRYTFEFGGNTAVVKIITGHKDTKMLDRYVNLTAEQVSLLMRGEEFPERMRPAGVGSSVWDVALSALETVAPELAARTARRSEAMRLRRAAQLGANREVPTSVPAPSNVITVDFGRRAA